MSWYRTGTVAVTSAGTIVTGSGTSWLDNASAGEGFVGPDGKMYEIASVDSNTQLTLAEAYLGSTASGQSYKIPPTQSFIRDLASAVSALVEAYRGVADAIDAGKFTIDASGISAIDINGGTADDVVIGGSSAAAGAFTTLITSSTITASGAVTGTRFIPSGSTVPTNGLYLPAANTLGWAINSAEKMRLDSSGNLGIGVIPTYLLDASHVTGTTTVGNGTVARFVSSTTNGDVNIRLGSGSNSTVRLGANGTDFYVYVNGAERARVDSSGNLLVGVTSATSNGGKIETSNGITFPATQSACSNANTLDDYEEGTWTATVTFGGANVGMTYATRTAHYVKVGSTCFFQLYLRLSAKGSSTGLAVVGGLPFTSDGSSAYSAVAVSIYDPIAGTAIASTTATVGSSSTNISLYSTTGGTLLYLTQGSFTDDTAVVVSGHYKVA